MYNRKSIKGGIQMTDMEFREKQKEFMEKQSLKNILIGLYGLNRTVVENLIINSKSNPEESNEAEVKIEKVKK